MMSALSWSRGQRRPLHHGIPRPRGSGAGQSPGRRLLPPDPRYYDATSIKNFTAPDPLYRGFDALGDVIPEARKRGMSVYPYYCETAHSNIKALWQPGFATVLEVDATGGVGSRPRQQTRTTAPGGWASR